MRRSNSLTRKCFVYRNRFNFSESETETDFIDCIAIGIRSICFFAGIRKMVGGADIAEDICIFSDVVFAANVQLGRLHIQHA